MKDGCCSAWMALEDVQPCYRTRLVLRTWMQVSACALHKCVKGDRTRHSLCCGLADRVRRDAMRVKPTANLCMQGRSRDKLLSESPGLVVHGDALGKAASALASGLQHSAVIFRAQHSVASRVARTLPTASSGIRPASDVARRLRQLGTPSRGQPAPSGAFCR